jgi:ribonuclease HI
MATHLTIYTDGGSRGNPGPAGIGVSVVNEKGEEIYFYGEAIGTATNNEAEYQGFLHSAEWLARQDLDEIATVDWKLDSKLVVEQLQRNWKVKEPRMREYAQKAWQILDSLSISFSISHVPRAQNKRADALVNQALDLVA